MRGRKIFFLAKIFISLFCLTAGSPQLAAEPISQDELEFANRLPDSLVEAFHVQIKSELDGAHFYLGLANIFYLKNLDGFGHWFTQQYYEELNHARIMMDYLKKKNARVVLSAIDAPEALPSEEPAAIFEKGLFTEETQSSRIQILHEKSVAANARDAATFLQWFIDEQVQEEDHFQDVLDRINMVRGSLEGILLIDKELALRAPAVIWTVGQPLPPH